MVFPTLDVAGRPVVEEANAKHVFFGLGDVHRFAQVVAGAYKDAQLQLHVQALARGQCRCCCSWGHGLADGTAKLLTRHANAGGAAVVTNRYPFVIGQQGVVGAELLAGVGGVVNGCEEVGVVTNAGGHVVFGLGLWDQASLQRGLLGCTFAQCAGQGQAQGAPSRRAHGHQGIELVLCACLDHRAGVAGDHTAGGHRSQVQNLISNGHAAAERFLGALASKRRKGQVLDRKVSPGCVGRAHPAAQRGVVGFIQQGHGVVVF